MKTFEDYALFDIHLHLDGALSSDAIIKIAKEENITLPTYDPIELRKYLEVPKDCKSLNEYLEKFDLPNLVLQTKYGLKEVTNDLLERLSKQGLKYVEIRMAPQLSTNKGLSQKEVVETLLEVINKSQEVYSIKANLILCLMRGADHIKNMVTVEVAKEFLGKGVVALDLAGAEALFPNNMYLEEFELARKYGIPFTIHAGEASDFHSVESALNMGAVRIGHGIHSIQNEETMNRLVESKIPLEICPTSNLDTKAIASLKDLKLDEFMKRGVIVTINTDDPTVSNTTLKEEYKLLKKMGLSVKDAKQIALNTINSSFLSQTEKELFKQFVK